MVQLADTNGDGRLSEGEMLRWFAQALAEVGPAEAELQLQQVEAMARRHVARQEVRAAAAAAAAAAGGGGGGGDPDYTPPSIWRFGNLPLYLAV